MESQNYSPVKKTAFSFSKSEMFSQKCFEKEDRLEGNIKFFPCQATTWQRVLCDAATYMRTDNST